MKVDFATFCYKGDAHRLHAPGQIIRQIKSNNFLFGTMIIIYQGVRTGNYMSNDFCTSEITKCCKVNTSVPVIENGEYGIDAILTRFGIDLDRSQYVSQTDAAHTWKNHVVNHLAAVKQSEADYIVFADNDCWIVRQPKGKSWVDIGIKYLESHPEIFIVSPNDGEPQRVTQRMSQQMFLARVDEFRNADFNQPGWDGNVNIPGGPMPEYWAMLEGRMELHCRVTGQYRYVLGPEYRYYHHNKLTKDDLFETDLSKY